MMLSGVAALVTRWIADRYMTGKSTLWGTKWELMGPVIDWVSIALSLVFFGCFVCYLGNIAATT